MSRYVPGVWAVGKHERFEAEKKQPIFYVYKPGYRTIARMAIPGDLEHGCEDPKEREANARLIASAPLLHEMAALTLEMLVQTGISGVSVDAQKFKQTLEKILAYIAEGRHE
jgi:hypothetical protein